MERGGTTKRVGQEEGEPHKGKDMGTEKFPLGKSGGSTIIRKKALYDIRKKRRLPKKKKKKKPAASGRQGKPKVHSGGAKRRDMGMVSTGALCRQQRAKI